MHTVSIPAGTIEYVQEGEGPPVVLLHGLLMDHTVWDTVMPSLPVGFRYIRPLLPLGSHRIPLPADADLTLPAMVHIVADFLEALNLLDVTVVHADWGGALFLTAFGRDERVGRLVILPCEAFDNFPPGLPGRMVSIAARIPGGYTLAARQLRVGWLRKLPLLYGWMVARPIDDALIRRWTEPVLTQPEIRRDLAKYAASRLDTAQLVADTEALRGFQGDALVLWSPDNRVMPPTHGPRLASLLPRGTYMPIYQAAVLSMLDAPAEVAGAIGGFLAESTRHVGS